MANHTIPDFQMQLARGQALLSNHKPALEFAVMAVLYIIPAMSSMSYFSKPRKAAVVNLPIVPLLVHILISFGIAGRYYATQLFSLPVPNGFDLALGLAQPVSALILAKYILGQIHMRKASFQTVALMEFLPIAFAYTMRDSEWHRTFVKMVDWFAIYRWTYVAVRNYRLLGFHKGVEAEFTHLVSVPVMLWISGFPYGIPLYYVVLASVMALESWTTSQISTESDQSQHLAKLLTSLGFCAHDIRIPSKQKATPNKSE